jgi:hypothetical protein
MYQAVLGFQTYPTSDDHGAPTILLTRHFGTPHLRCPFYNRIVAYPNR